MEGKRFGRISVVREVLTLSALRSVFSSPTTVDKHTKISSEEIFDGREYSLLFLYVKVVVSCKVVGLYGTRRRVLKIKLLKHGIIQDKRGNVMRAVFGIDVSKTSSEVAILVNSEKVHGYTILNEAIGFNRPLGDLKTVHNPEIIFEVTGLYSRRLQVFLEEYSYAYTRLNPLEAKKQLNSLQVRKTDKIDAEKLAKSQLVHNRKPTYVQEEVYQHLSDLSRFYLNMTEDLVRAKKTFTQGSTNHLSPIGKTLIHTNWRAILELSDGFTMQRVCIKPISK